MAKRDYEAPQLEEYGTVADLTQVGLTTPGGDVEPGTQEPAYGSVYPPGGGTG
jgi:hypothetical protein